MAIITICFRETAFGQNYQFLGKTVIDMSLYAALGQRQYFFKQATAVIIELVVQQLIIRINKMQFHRLSRFETFTRNGFGVSVAPNFPSR